MTVATRSNPPAGVMSPTFNGGAVGAKMQVLDTIERLLTAADHPDIVKVERYGPGDGPWGPTVQESKVKHITGVKVTHQSTATASVWEAIWPGEQPVDPPTTLPAPRSARAPRLLILVSQLLDVAQPETLKAWRLVTLPDLGATGSTLPAGLSLVDRDGGRLLLRATATGPTVGDEPTVDPFPDYVIPEEVKTCLQPSAASAGRW
jgi:hypothetical protein